MQSNQLSTTRIQYTFSRLFENNFSLVKVTDISSPLRRAPAAALLLGALAERPAPQKESDVQNPPPRLRPHLLAPPPFGPAHVQMGRIHN